MRFDLKFEFGERVVVDGDQSLVMRATAVTYRPAAFAEWELSYFLEGESKKIWIEEYRIEKAENRGREK